MSYRDTLAIHAAAHADREAAVTEPIDQDRTLTFPNRIVKRQAEVAIDRERERQETRNRLADAARLDTWERVGHILELGDETYIVEIIRGEESVWTVNRGGRADYRGFYTIDEALLLAVELRNGGGSNDQGHIYAARMLGAGKSAEGATR